MMHIFQFLKRHLMNIAIWHIIEEKKFMVRPHVDMMLVNRQTEQSYLSEDLNERANRFYIVQWLDQKCLTIS